MYDIFFVLFGEVLGTGPFYEDYRSIDHTDLCCLALSRPHAESSVLLSH